MLFEPMRAEHKGIADHRLKPLGHLVKMLGIMK